MREPTENGGPTHENEDEQSRGSLDNGGRAGARNYNNRLSSQLAGKTKEERDNHESPYEDERSSQTSPVSRMMRGQATAQEEKRALGAEFRRKSG